MLIIAASALSGDQKPTIKNNTVLTLDFKTNIIDSPTEDQESLFSFSDQQKNILIFDMLDALKKAKSDDKIKGISINLISYGRTTFFLTNFVCLNQKLAI